MKKFKFSVAILAIVFAIIGSAFINKNNILVADGFYANKDHDPDTEQLPLQDDQSEVNIDDEVDDFDSNLSAWAEEHCFEPDNITCAVDIRNNIVMDRKLGTYQP